MSWKPEVQVSGEGDKWNGNALRFATREEALANAANLAGRWMLVTDYRASESDEPVNYEWVDADGNVTHRADGRLKFLGE